jgi:hypothetical protein
MIATTMTSPDVAFAAADIGRPQSERLRAFLSNALA